jgi:hypothetical protein
VRTAAGETEMFTVREPEAAATLIRNELAGSAEIG